MPGAPQYLDAHGDPVDAPEFLDEQGNPLTERRASGSVPKATALTGAGLGILKLAPTAASVVNKGAKAVSAIDPVVSSIIGSAVPHVGAAIGAGAPKAAGVIARATQPAGQAINTGNALLKATTKAGPLMKGASWLSRIAGKVALPLTMVSSYMDAAQLVKQLEDEVAARHPEVLAQREYGGF